MILDFESREFGAQVDASGDFGYEYTSNIAPEQQPCVGEFRPKHRIDLADRHPHHYNLGIYPLSTNPMDVVYASFVLRDRFVGNSSAIDIRTYRDQAPNPCKCKATRRQHLRYDMTCDPVYPPYTLYFQIYTYIYYLGRSGCSSSSPSSSSSLPSSSSKPSASRFSPRIPKLSKKPIKVMPPKTPNATASPLGSTCVEREKRPPARNGPAARPAAERVWARPLSVPRTE